MWSLAISPHKINIVGIFNLTDHSPPQILSFDETKSQIRFDGIVSNNHRSSAEQAEPE